ncbi:MAG: hypothetical protein KF690_07740 [Bacteroidetes bacterium]|nr:hypothetical protein [Bacteroidota bacterium]
MKGRWLIGFAGLAGQLLAISLHAQPAPRPLLCDVQADGPIPKALHQQLKYRVSKGDTVADSLLPTLHRHGYPEGEIDSLWRTSCGWQLRLRTGPAYRLRRLQIQGLAADHKLSKTTERDEVWYWPRTQQQLRSILQDYQQQGYPFASLVQDSLRYRQEPDGSVSVQVWLRLQPGKRYYLNQIILKGNLRERPQLVYNLIHLQPGDLLDRQRVNRIPSMLDNSPYYQHTSAPEIRYGPDSATLVIETEAKRANRLDGILGLLPPRLPGERIQWTGQVDLHLVSAFRAGEAITFKLDLLPNQSQNLDLRFLYPYLLGTPLSAEGGFSLLRQDTTFLNRHLTATARYAFLPQLAGTFGYRRFVSRLLSVQPWRETRWPPPPQMDSENNLWSVGFRYNSVDYLLNPSRGLWLDSDVAVGTKVTGRPAGLDSLDFTRLAARQPRQEYRLEARLYIPYGRATWLLGGRIFYLSLQEYFRNDLPFIGGNQTLRGFNENQFQASAWAIGTTELRLRLSRDAYMGVLVEGGVLEQHIYDTVTRIYPVATGFALSVPTAAGQVTLAYAVGSTQDIPFRPERGRVHLGLEARF